MTNEEFLAALEKVVASAVAQVANANAAGSTSNTSANQNSAGSGAAVADSRTRSNIEDIQVGSDINVPEGWSSHALEATQKNRVHFDNMVSQQLTHVANLNHLTLQALSNNQNQSNLGNLLALDRSWNVNETDAYATILAAKIAESLMKGAKKDA